MQSVRIPDHIDAPYEILFWEADELMPVMMILGVGYITRTLTLSLIPAYLFWKYFKKQKDNRRPGFLAHWLWRNTGLLPLCRRFSNGFVTKYLE